ncbi:MAG TPA: hypothetical protein VFM63_12965 [Pyrinomonadaceae bacterium]|nr:hypothetical protein [Pyrinomonadaceae bacterium]
MDSQHLLVPIKVQALVIDDIVIKKTGAISFQNRLIANDGRWSPQLQNYQPLLVSAKAPGSRPFFGATRKFDNRDTDQLVLDPATNREAIPQEKDRGVYLHWVLPAGLRHAYTPGLLDFPPLPDHWLIVRFSQQDSTVKTKAWFVDGGAVVADTAPTNLVFPGTGKYVGKRVGKVIPLEQFATANFSGERAPAINAIGTPPRKPEDESTPQIGSPTFTASIAENRNIFSWHDDLNDLRGTNADKSVRENTTLTYYVLGWYRDAQNEPLVSPCAKVTERRDASDRLLGWLIDPPGWSIDAPSGAPVELLKRRSVFHGMVAQINYWSSEVYRGTILGYPGAPSVGGTMSETKPGFKVGVGNNAEDALVSLVSSEYSGQQKPKSFAAEQPNLWKALEAVIYRQAETLVKSWNVAPRDMTVHQNWFETREAGKIWYIRPAPDQTGVFPDDPAKAAAQTAVQPTADQLALLKELNQAQADADATSRDLAALQQDLYVRWWKLVSKSKTAFAEPEKEEAECRTLVKQVDDVRQELNRRLAKRQPLEDHLKSKLPGSLGLELKYDAAPRFWAPSDPVVVVKNCGSPKKHQFPREHPCRLPEQIISTGKVTINRLDTTTFSTPTGVADIATAAQKYLPSCPAIINALLNEASIVEQAVRHLVDKTAAPKKPFHEAGAWSRWTEQLVNDLTWDGDVDSYPTDQVTFGPDSYVVRPHRLVDLWAQQPWSPLFIDWQITWFPTAKASTPEQPFGPVWNFDEADFIPRDKQSIPTEGFTMRGRSLLSPIDERIFKEPLQTLSKLLKARNNDGKQEFPPAVIDVLERYEVVWNSTLSDLPRGGLMGQALTGFHQSLLRRDVTLPRINPDTARPWLKDLKELEQQVGQLLGVPSEGGVTADRLSPPVPGPITAKTLPFSLIRAGALRIDELWLVDDFGQFADLLGTTIARSTSSGQVFHPRMRWHDDPKVLAMPPRVLQPARLNFRFTAASETRNESEPALNSICGWIFYNPLDQALVLCDRKGELMGHLVIGKERGGIRIKWDAGAGGVALAGISNKVLREFAESLIEEPRSDKPKLIQLLSLIDNSLDRIRPAATRRDTIVAGRPLALVTASVGLELFGKAWTDPHADPPAPREGTGDQSLDALQVRVNLGHAYSVEDGLIGYFKEGAYQRIVVPQLPQNVTASPYIGDQNATPLRVGFRTTERIVLLMDPWGSVQAACGLVPSKTITLATPELNKTVAQMEASFRVGPVLLQADRLALPTPTGNKGIWNFAGPTTNQKAAAVAALDPRYFSEHPVIATEGRLLLLNEE